MTFSLDNTLVWDSTAFEQKIPKYDLQINTSIYILFVEIVNEGAPCNFF